MTMKPDLTDENRCISVHWQLPVQCELPSSHSENWHESRHPESARPIRYRRSMGVWATEEMLEDGTWYDLRIPAPTPFRVVTLCGSMKFYPRMLEVASKLTTAGRIVLMPHDASLTGIANKTATEHGAMLDSMHRAKIRMSQSVYVVNTGGYIGESTRSEIAYATELGIPIEYDANTWTADDGTVWDLTETYVDSYLDEWAFTGEWWNVPAPEVRVPLMCRPEGGPRITLLWLAENVGPLTPKRAINDAEAEHDAANAVNYAPTEPTAIAAAIAELDAEFPS